MKTVSLSLDINNKGDQLARRDQTSSTTDAGHATSPASLHPNEDTERIGDVRSCAPLGGDAGELYLKGQTRYPSLQDTPITLSDIPIQKSESFIAPSHVHDTIVVTRNEFSNTSTDDVSCAPNDSIQSVESFPQRPSSRVDPQSGQGLSDALPSTSTTVVFVDSNPIEDIHGTISESMIYTLDGGRQPLSASFIGHGYTNKSIIMDNALQGGCDADDPEAQVTGTPVSTSSVPASEVFPISPNNSFIETHAAVLMASAGSDTSADFFPVPSAVDIESRIVSVTSISQSPTPAATITMGGNPVQHAQFGSPREVNMVTQDMMKTEEVDKNIESPKHENAHDVSSTLNDLPEQGLGASANATLAPQNFARPEQMLPQMHAVPEMYHLHDDVVHDPLGAASYLFERVGDFGSHILLNLGIHPDHRDCQGRDVVLTVHFGTQPNNSPHVGTIVTFATAAIVARSLKRHWKSLSGSGNGKLTVKMQLDLVETAPDSAQTQTIENIQYQRSLGGTGALNSYIDDYNVLVESLSEFIRGEIPIKMHNQKTLTSMPYAAQALEAIIKDRDCLGRLLSPKTGYLGLRAACPQKNCGWTDKHGIGNCYSTTPSGATLISFLCPVHGTHTISLDDPDGVQRLEFNTPLRNLVRALVYDADTEASRKQDGPEQIHLRVTGSDYAGYYQEQFLLSPIRRLFSNGLRRNVAPVIVYAPLIVDWAGSKLSKSLYVKDGAYKYLDNQGMGYLLSFKKLRESGREVETLFQEVEKWVDVEPKKLFRPYSVEYLHYLFEKKKRSN